MSTFAALSSSSPSTSTPTHTSTSNTTTTSTSTTTVYHEEIWFFVLNPLFILCMMTTSCLCVYSVHALLKGKTTTSQSAERMRIGVLICVCLFGIIRSASLGMQIQMGISTKGMIPMFDIAHIAALAPFYGALLVMLRQWVLTCMNMKFALRKSKIPYATTNIFFTATHLFVYAVTIIGIVKSITKLEDIYSVVYDYLVIVIFSILFISYSITGWYMLRVLINMQRNKTHLGLGDDDNTATTYIKKMAIALSIFLVCVLWRMVDFAVYKWAKSSDGKWVYTSTMQVELYPLESTFPEYLPMAFCFFLYKQLPWREAPPKKIIQLEVLS